MELPKVFPANSQGLFVYLVGGNIGQRAMICHTFVDDRLHIEPVATVEELASRDSFDADAILAWDEGETVAEVAGCLAGADRWVPIIAIGTLPTARSVVRAITAGALDYFEWPCDGASLRHPLHAICKNYAELRSRKQRQFVARQAIRRLSPREQQVLDALSRGRANKEIARELCISPRTVEIHRANLMAKLDARNSADAVRIALEASLPDLATFVVHTSEASPLARAYPFPPPAPIPALAQLYG